MTTEQILAAVKIKFDASDSKFEDGYLWLKDSYCKNLQKRRVGWNKTMYSEQLTKEFLGY